MEERTWRVIPRKALGFWSVGLIIVMPILFVIGSSFSDSIYESVPAGKTILADIGARPILALTMLTGMATGVSAFITGLISILKHKERTVLVYLSTILGGLFILYLIAELAFPH